MIFIESSENNMKSFLIYERIHNELNEIKNKDITIVNFTQIKLIQK